MIIDRYFKIILTFIGVALWLIAFKLWLAPQEAQADDVDIENRLSYISKIVGAIESSIIKIEGDMRFVRRRADISSAAKEISEKRLNIMESKVVSMEENMASLEMDIAEMDGNIAYIENDIGDLVTGVCDNIFLCRQKKY